MLIGIENNRSHYAPRTAAVRRLLSDDTGIYTGSRSIFARAGRPVCVGTRADCIKTRILLDNIRDVCKRGASVWQQHMWQSLGRAAIASIVTWTGLLKTMNLRAASIRVPARPTIYYYDFLIIIRIMNLPIYLSSNYARKKYRIIINVCDDDSR